MMKALKLSNTTGYALCNSGSKGSIAGPMLKLKRGRNTILCKIQIQSWTLQKIMYRNWSKIIEPLPFQSIKNYPCPESRICSREVKGIFLHWSRSFRVDKYFCSRGWIFSWSRRRCRSLEVVLHLSKYWNSHFRPTKINIIYAWKARTNLGHVLERLLKVVSACSFLIKKSCVCVCTFQ